MKIAGFTVVGAKYIIRFYQLNGDGEPECFHELTADSQEQAEQWVQDHEQDIADAGIYSVEIGPLYEVTT